MRRKFCRLSVAFIILLAIASAVVAQEVSQKIQVQSSPLNLRKIGESAITNSGGANAKVSVPRGLTTTGKQSPLVTMHSIAHHWGRVLAQKQLGSAALQPRTLPSVTPLPVIAPDPGFSGFAALTGAERALSLGLRSRTARSGALTDGKVVLEAINVAALVYDATSHKVLAGPVYLNNFFGVVPNDFTSDPRCYYDPSTQRWFVTLTDLGGPTTDLLLAVSQSSDPTGSFSLYAIETINDGFFGVCPCFGDQPLLGSGYERLLHLNQFVWCGVLRRSADLCALEFALELGITPFGVRITPLLAEGGLPEPFSLQPSISPDGHGAPENGGTEYFVSSYDIGSTTNNKVSVWAMTDTDTLDAEVGIPGFTTVAVSTETYVDLPA